MVKPTKTLVTCYSGDSKHWEKMFRHIQGGSGPWRRRLTLTQCPTLLYVQKQDTFSFPIWLWVKTNGTIAPPPILAYFREDWDVHRGYGLLTHGYWWFGARGFGGLQDGVPFALQDPKIHIPSSHQPPTRTVAQVLLVQVSLCTQLGVGRNMPVSVCMASACHETARERERHHIAISLES